MKDKFNTNISHSVEPTESVSQHKREEKILEYQQNLKHIVDQKKEIEGHKHTEHHEVDEQHVHFTDPHPINVEPHVSLDESLTRAQRAHRSQRRRARLHQPKATHPEGESHKEQGDESGEEGEWSSEGEKEQPTQQQQKTREEVPHVDIKPEDASTFRGYLKETVGTLAEKFGQWTGINYLKEQGKTLVEEGKTEIELAHQHDEGTKVSEKTDVMAEMAGLAGAKAGEQISHDMDTDKTEDSKKIKAYMKETVGGIAETMGEMSGNQYLLDRGHKLVHEGQEDYNAVAMEKGKEKDEGRAQ